MKLLYRSLLTALLLGACATVPVEPPEPPEQIEPPEAGPDNHFGVGLYGVCEFEPYYKQCGHKT